MSLPTAVALEIARGNFPEAGTFRCALYDTVLNGTSAQAYSTTNELATAGGYTQGGFLLAALGALFWVLSVTTAVFAPANVVSSAGSTFTFIALLIYNSAGVETNNGLYFFNAGSNQVVSNGTLTIVWPTADSATGLVRVPQ